MEKNIPEEDNPALFGLPANIGTTREMAETGEIIRQIRNIQIVGTTDVPFDRYFSFILHQTSYCKRLRLNSKN